MLRYFKQNSCDGSLPNPTGPLPIFHHRPFYTQESKSKLSLIENPHDMYIHNSLSKVAIHMPYINIHHIVRYQLEMVFVCAHLSPIAMGTMHTAQV